MNNANIVMMNCKTTHSDIQKFNADISAAALYYASYFRRVEHCDGMDGVRIAPHISGTGVVVSALNGHDLGMFYDKSGIINGECILDMEDNFFKTLKPVSCIKKNKPVDKRVLFDNGQASFKDTKGMLHSTDIKFQAEYNFPDVDVLIAGIKNCNNNQLDTIAFPFNALKKFIFPEYPEGTAIMHTQCIYKGEPTEDCIFKGFVYVIRNLGLLPFEFFGLTMPLYVQGECIYDENGDIKSYSYENMKGIPQWIKQR